MQRVPIRVLGASHLILTEKHAYRAAWRSSYEIGVARPLW